MHRSHVRTLLFSAIALIAVSPLGAQTPQEPDAFDPAFLEAPADLPVELIGTQTQSAGPRPAAPAPVESPAAEFRRIVQELRIHRHQYVHCRLKTGKILTGQIKDAGFEAFSIQTDVLGEHHRVRYEDLAEAPRPVPAVGTRFKQSAQWAGIGALFAVAIPLLFVLSPLLYASGMDLC